MQNSQEDWNRASLVWWTRSQGGRSQSRADGRMGDEERKNRNGERAFTVILPNPDAVCPLFFLLNEATFSFLPQIKVKLILFVFPILLITFPNLSTFCSARDANLESGSLGAPGVRICSCHFGTPSQADVLLSQFPPDRKRLKQS